jgi:hypothetical protein
MRALAALLLLGACAAPGPDAVPRGCDGRITLTNIAPQGVEQFYASRAGAADWGPDRLDAAGVPPGATRGFALTPGRNSLRIVFGNGRAAEIGNVDICGTPRVTVSEGGIAAQP